MPLDGGIEVCMHKEIHDYTPITPVGVNLGLTLIVSPYLYLKVCIKNNVDLY